MKILMYDIIIHNHEIGIAELHSFTTLDDANAFFDEVFDEIENGEFDADITHPNSRVIDTDLFQEVDIEVEETEEAPLQDAPSSL